MKSSSLEMDIFNLRLVILKIQILNFENQELDDILIKQRGRLIQLERQKDKIFKTKIKRLKGRIDELREQLP